MSAHQHLNSAWADSVRDAVHMGAPIDPPTGCRWNIDSLLALGTICCESVYSAHNTFPATIKQVDAAKKYGVSDRTLRRWENAGLISGKRVRGVKLYPLETIEKLVGLR